MINYQKMFDSIAREIESIKRRLHQRPVLTVTAAAVEYRIGQVLDGNTLETGQDGIQYSDDVITSVPSAYDPDVDDSFIPGIGRGPLSINGVLQPGNVLFVNDPRGVNGNDVVASDNFYAGGPVAISVDGGGTVLAYTVN